MNVDDYLKRFNSANYKEPSIQNLFRLQSNHLLNVPFENLDIHLNCQYESLDLEFLYDKIVNKKRGGFCCELNYLFYWLLDRLGYRVALLTCRPYQVKREQYSEWFSHMALQVSMNESQFIVDVGFAQNYRAPLKFQLNHIQPDVTGHYKIVPAAPAAVAAQHAAAPTQNASSRRLEQVTVAPVAIEPSGESSSSNNNNNNNNTVAVTTTTTANQHLNPNSIYASSTSFTSSSSSSSSTSSSTFSSSPSNANHLHHHNTFVIQKSLSEDLAQWMPLYEFNIIPKRIEEFKHMVEFVKSKEHLRFHERSICVIHTTYSVLKLVGHKLSEVIFSNSTEKSRTQSTLTTNEVFDAIRNIYGITLDREFEPKEEQ